MADLLWEGLIVSLVLLLGINIGLTMGLTRFSKGKVLSLSAIYGAVLLALSMLVKYSTSLYDFTVQYIPYMIGIIGLLTIINGIYTIIKWKKDKKENYPFVSVTTMIPTICCFVGFFFTAILLNNKNTEPDFLFISVAMVVLFAAIVTIFYLFSNFLRYAERPYSVLLGNFMILNGFYFVIAGLFLPTIKTLATVQTSPLTIDSPSSLIFLIMAGLGVLLIGVYLKREGKPV